MKPAWKRRVRGFLPVDDEPEVLPCAYFARIKALRAEGRIGIVLSERGQYFISDSTIDIWGQKRAISKRNLMALVDGLEAEAADRIPPRSERGPHAARSAAV